jgi:acetyl-CoA acyltransferase
MTEAVIVGAARSPIGRKGGGLRDVHPVMLGAAVVSELVKRARIEPGDVQDMLWGCVDQVGEQGTNIARSTWLATGFPVTTPGTTIDRQCASSQQGVHFAAALIKAGFFDVIIAGGAESMSRVPIGANNTGPGDPFPAELLGRYDLTHQGIAAEHVARKYRISRADMDRFGLRSHQRAAKAQADGRFEAEIVPVQPPGTDHRPGQAVTADEGIRPHTSFEAMASLRPAFAPDHGITAGNSSQLSDGAAAMLVMSDTRAHRLGLEPRARISAQAVVGTDPVLMHEGPIAATAAILSAAGLTIDDIDLFEVSEAFASVVLAWLQQTGADPERVNVNGGAIALGHPLGASGARLMITLLHELERRQLRFGLQVMCAGWGIGLATLIDRDV